MEWMNIILYILYVYLFNKLRRCSHVDVHNIKFSSFKEYTYIILKNSPSIKKKKKNYRFLYQLLINIKKKSFNNANYGQSNPCNHLK